jgi:hypothetical protein
MSKFSTPEAPLKKESKIIYFFSFADCKNFDRFFLLEWPWYVVDKKFNRGIIFLLKEVNMYTTDKTEAET